MPLWAMLMAATSCLLILSPQAHSKTCPLSLSLILPHTGHVLDVFSGGTKIKGTPYNAAF